MKIHHVVNTPNYMKADNPALCGRTTFTKQHIWDRVLDRHYIPTDHSVWCEVCKELLPLALLDGE